MARGRPSVEPPTGFSRFLRGIRSWLRSLPGEIATASVAALVLAALGAGWLVVRGGSDEQRDPATRSAEPGTALDLSHAVRVYTGPGSSNAFVDEARVQQGNVIQVSSIFQAVSRRARDVHLIVRIDKGPDETLSSRAELVNANPKHAPGFVPFDDVVLEGARREINAYTPRSFVLQTNRSRDNGVIDLDAGRVIPERLVSVSDEGAHWEVRVRPTADGTLTPDPRDVMRVTFLVDIYEVIQG